MTHTLDLTRSARPFFVKGRRAWQWACIVRDADGRFIDGAVFDTKAEARAWGLSRLASL